jgi:hypothetical protein
MSAIACGAVELVTNAVHIMPAMMESSGADPSVETQTDIVGPYSLVVIYYKRPAKGIFEHRVAIIAGAVSCKVWVLCDINPGDRREIGRSKCIVELIVHARK